MTDTYQQNNFSRPGVTEVRAVLQPWSAFRTVELAMWCREANTAYLAQPVMMKLQTEQHALIEPFVRLGADQAQQLMDELYRCGIRPTEGAGSVGQMGAVQAHLEDMRKLVFKAPL